MAMKMTFLPNSDKLILACAMENSKINLYIEKENTDLELHLTAALGGHENWVRSLDFIEGNLQQINLVLVTKICFLFLVNDTLLLASASQDSFVRLWKIMKGNIDDIDYSVYNSTFDMDGIDYIVVLESILMGHENWVYAANWSPNKESVKLVTASLDKTAIIWEQDSQTNLWLESIRVGEVCVIIVLI